MIGEAGKKAAASLGAACSVLYDILLSLTFPDYSHKRSLEIGEETVLEARIQNAETL